MKSDCDFVIRPKLQTLSESEVEYLFGRALEVIECVGVRVLHPEAIELLKSAGASVSDKSIAKIKPCLVENAIKSVPKQLMIYDREGNPAMRIGGKNTGGLNTYYGTGSDLTHMYDPFTENIRLTVSDDIGNMAKIVDYLNDIDFVMSYGIPSDVSLDKIYQTEFVQMVENTTKPIIFTSDNGKVSKEIIEMAAIAVGGIETLVRKPFIINYAQPTSPLQHSGDALEKMFVCAEYGIPVVYPPGMIPGATAPVTIAGAIIQSIAEGFSALTIHQLKRKSAPIILCGAHGCMDMRTSINVYAAPERLMTEAALSSVYQYFEIPTWGFGGCSDALIIDAQAGMEFGMMSLWAALCGINMAHDVGYLGSGMVGDLRAIVFNDEINRYVRHILNKGVGINAVTLALDLIKKVGPGGNFLMEEHTLNHFRDELWKPFFINRDNLKGWRDKKEPRVEIILGKKVKEILNNYESQPLDKEKRTLLQKMLRV